MKKGAKLDADGDDKLMFFYSALEIEMKRTTASNEFTIKPYISKKKLREAADQQTETKDSSPDPLPDVSCINKSNRLTSFPTVSHCTIPQTKITSRKEHSKSVTSLQWNTIKRPSQFVTSSLDKTLIIWDYSYKKLCLQHKFDAVHTEGIKDVRWSKNGEYLLTASFDKTSKIIDAEKGASVLTLCHDDMVTRVCWHPTENHIFLSGTTQSGVFAWDMRQKNTIKKYKSHFGQIQDILFLNDGKTFLTSSEVLRRNSMDQTIMAWDFETTAVLSTQIYQEPYACTMLRQHPKQKTILAQSLAGYIVIFDNTTPWKMNKYKRYEGHQSTGHNIGFDISADGRFIYCGDNQGQLFVYDNYSSEILKKYQSFSSPLISVECDRTHSSRIALSSWDGEVAIWE